MSKEYYQRIGRLIFATLRHGGSETDLKQWIAAEEGKAGAAGHDGLEDGSTYAAFLEKYAAPDAFDEACSRFLESLRGRTA